MHVFVSPANGHDVVALVLRQIRHVVDARLLFLARQLFGWHSSRWNDRNRQQTLSCTITAITGPRAIILLCLRQVRIASGALRSRRVRPFVRTFVTSHFENEWTDFDTYWYMGKMPETINFRVRRSEVKINIPMRPKTVAKSRTKSTMPRKCRARNWRTKSQGMKLQVVKMQDMLWILLLLIQRSNPIQSWFNRRLAVCFVVFDFLAKRYVRLMAWAVRLSSVVCSLWCDVVAETWTFRQHFFHHLIAQGLGQFVLKFRAKIRKGFWGSCKLNKSGYEKLAFLDQYIALFRKRYKTEVYCSYNGRSIVSRIRSIDRRHFQWPRTTPNQHFKVTPIFDAEYLRVIGVVYDISKSTTFNDSEWPLTHIQRQAITRRLISRKRYKTGA